MSDLLGYVLLCIFLSWFLINESREGKWISLSMIVLWVVSFGMVAVQIYQVLSA